MHKRQRLWKAKAMGLLEELLILFSDGLGVLTDNCGTNFTLHGLNGHDSGRK